MIKPICNTAPMYNGGQLYKSSNFHQKQTSVDSTICVDYFDVTIEVSIATLSSCLLFSDNPVEHIQIGDFDFELGKAGTKRYKYIFQVYLDGELYGSLCVQPRSHDILNEEWCQFKLANHKLYQKGWTLGFDDFLNTLDAKVRSYTRIDIALDGYGYLSEIKDFQDGLFDRLGRASYELYYAKMGGQDRVITGVDWGSKKGDKFMTIYRKSDRIDAENKQYIKDFWTKSGLVMDDRVVERMELKMRSKAVKQIKDFDHSFLEDSRYLASVMKTHFKRWFEFIECSNDTNVSRAKRHEFIDWESIGAELLQKNSTKPSNELWSAKISIRQQYFFYHTNGGTSLVSLSKVVEFYGLENWYRNRVIDWSKKVSKILQKRRNRNISEPLKLAM